MPKIEGIRVRNYRSLRDVSLGKLWNTRAQPLTAISAVIGKNGVGKSTLFDAFGFLADCLKLGVEEACDARGRGGFERLRSRGQPGPISFEVYYRQDSDVRPITYELSIDLDGHLRPAVVRERLRQRRKGQSRGHPFSFLILERGEGYAWRGDAVGVSEEEEQDLLSAPRSVGEAREEPAEREFVQITDTRRLGIATLGALKQHERISAFRAFIEDWYLSYFTPDAARGLPLAGPQPHLNTHGDNLGNVVQFMERDEPERFRKILEHIATKIPGVQTITTEKTLDGRLLLCFNDRGFEDPFYSQQMSDGTLKVFAYLLLLEDPSPRPFICIEEPENGLYHKLLESLAAEFRRHTEKGGSQIFITTHQPYFVDALTPQEVWVLDKGSDGFSTIRRASEDPTILAMVKEGLPLGGLWYSDYLDAQ